MKVSLASTVLWTAATAAVVPTMGPAPQEAAVDTPKQLQSGQLWIRAVAAPNYHKYMQTKPANTPGPAILDSYTTAGQFNVEGGQLVNKIANPPLYLWVEVPADKASPPRTLSTWFNTTKNPFGSFAFQGDTLAWSDPSVKRQNTAAWLICKGQAMFINTGAYSYQTPAGCADQTVSLYSMSSARMTGLT
jgi:hypothetical protein